MTDPRWQTVREALLTVRREHPKSHRGEPALAALDSLEAEMEREKRDHEEMIAQFTDAAIHLTRAEAEMERLNKDWMAEADRAEKFVREMDDLRAEVERLRGRLKASGVIDLMRRAEKAEAENERLREWADQQVKRGDDEQIARKRAEAEVVKMDERLGRAVSEVARLREALRDYADPDTWNYVRSPDTGTAWEKVGGHPTPWVDAQEALDRAALGGEEE